MRNEVRYTKKSMREAAAACSTFEQVFSYFNVEPDPRLQTYLLRRFAHYEIDITHFAPRPYQRLPRPSVDELDAAVTQSVSVAQALRRLQRPVNTAQRASLTRWIREAGIDSTHFLGQASQRGKSIPAARKLPEEILVKSDGQIRTTTRLLRRALAEIGVPQQCARCGCAPCWQGKAMTLEIDHINGDWRDNRRENLRLLCPNCHAITTTWCRGGRREEIQPSGHSGR